MVNAKAQLAGTAAQASAAAIEEDRREAARFWGIQSTRSAQLPDPRPLLGNLTQSVLEVLAGTRELDQLMRWLTQDVYETLLKRVLLSARARVAKGERPQRPRISVLRTIVAEPSDGVVEAVVIVETPIRVRAIAIRLEGLDRRWRASAISVL